jgi:hypothetical protein
VIAQVNALGKRQNPGTRLDSPDDMARLLPDHLPRFRPGHRLPWLPDWEFAELLGVGGFAEVWKIVNHELNEASALKVCRCNAAVTLV